MTQDDGFVLYFGSNAVIACKHVHLSLIDPQLTNVGLQEEDVRALHERIQDLCRSQTALHSTHDLAAFFDSSNVEAPSNIQHVGPVLVGMGRKFFRTPLKLDVGEVHSRGLPDLEQVFSDRFDFVQVPPHFVVHEGKPIGDPKNKGRIRSGKGAFVDVHGLEDALRNVHAAARFEAIVQVEPHRVVGSAALCQDQAFQFVRVLAFLAHRQNPVVVGLHFGRPIPLGFRFLLLAAAIFVPPRFLFACSGIDFKIAHFFGWDFFASFSSHCIKILGIFFYGLLWFGLVWFVQIQDLCWMLTQKSVLSSDLF
mmetsp:Transcript_22769/g.48168  ORF Transcript_22769/g.48168 Transcript_22769/m.48168 type:complete len:309 (-) Transcript_22769:133-1059(-)